MSLFSARSCLVGLVACFCLISGVSAPAAVGDDSTGLRWLNADSSEGPANAWFRWAIDQSVSESDAAELVLVTDAHCSLYVNGQRIMKHQSLERTDNRVAAVGYDLKSLLRHGRNSLALELHSESMNVVAGISLTSRSPSGTKEVGGVWRMNSTQPPVGWQQTDFNDRDWQELKPVSENPGEKFAITMPAEFSGPVTPAKSRRMPFEFEDGDHVVMVGATFLERAQLSEHLEATMAGTCGTRHVTFRNLGWSADTSSADSRGIFDAPEIGFLRLIEHIRAEEPTVVLISYGQNEALNSKVTPEQYELQSGRLLDELNASGIPCVLMSPHELFPARLPLPSPSRFNARLRIFSEATASVAQSRGVPFIDLFSSFSEQMLAIDEQMNATPGSPDDHAPFDGAESASAAVISSLSENGMHLTDRGYAAAAVVLRDRLLTIPAEQPAVHLDFEGAQIMTSTVTIRNVHWNADSTQLVTFDMLEPNLSPLPFVMTHSRRNDETGSIACTIRLADSEQILEHRSLSKEQETAKSGGRATETCVAPLNPQYEALRELVRRKNELYFHRWRPQNITYLFGFRKHEQGNNAADIARFDPLIQDLEKQIHTLQQPQWRTVTVRHLTQKESR